MANQPNGKLIILGSEKIFEKLKKLFLEDQNVLIIKILIFFIIL
jgi:hypothetical protein